MQAHFARLGVILFNKNSRAEVLSSMKNAHAEEPIAALPHPCALKIFSLAGISVERATLHIKFDRTPLSASIGGNYWVAQVSHRCRQAVGKHTNLADELVRTPDAPSTPHTRLFP